MRELVYLRSITSIFMLLLCYAPINVKPEGGTPGICGAFDLFCLPHPREFDLESGPQGGDVCFFFARRTGS